MRRHATEPVVVAAWIFITHPQFEHEAFGRDAADNPFPARETRCGVC
jgi:hypothetical protein